jgi:hypothetical protein
MGTLHVFPRHNIRTVAIVNNDDYDFGLNFVTLELAGFEVVYIRHQGRSLEEIATLIKNKAQAAVCGHRFGTHPYGSSPFYGAELAARLYDMKIPTLLVTQYIDIDMHIIRKWKDKLPVVLHPREFDFENVEEHFATCTAELRGDTPESRVLYHVRLHVRGTEHAGNEVVVDATCVDWDHYQIIRFPLSLIPAELHDKIVEDTWLSAHGNIRARSVGDLYFNTFALSRDPEEEYDPETDEIPHYCEVVE